MIRSQNVIIVCHKNLTQPDDDLEIYLNSEKIDNLVHIRHSFSSTTDRMSYYTWFKKGRLYREHKSYDYRMLPEPLIYLKELFFTLIWTLQSRLYYDRYIGMDGMCVLFGEVLKKLRCVKQTTYFVMDFVPYGRFKSKLKEKIYHYINKWAYLLSDEIWDDWGGERISLRNKIYGINTPQDKIHRVVPYGVWVDTIRKYTFDDCEQETIVFMGHILEKQGVQYLLKAIPDLLHKRPNIRIKIIGDGPYLETLKKIAAELQIDHVCNFKGKIEDYHTLLYEIASSALGVALYIPDKKNFSYYGDNGKIKTYLGCGVPVVMTDVSWMVKEIEDYGCGRQVVLDPGAISSTLNDMLLPSVNALMRKKAIAYANKFNNQKIFSDLAI